MSFLRARRFVLLLLALSRAIPASAAAVERLNVLPSLPRLPAAYAPALPGALAAAPSVLPQAPVLSAAPAPAATVANALPAAAALSAAAAPAPAALQTYDVFDNAKLIPEAAAVAFKERVTAPNLGRMYQAALRGAVEAEPSAFPHPRRVYRALDRLVEGLPGAKKTAPGHHGVVEPVARFFASLLQGLSPQAAERAVLGALHKMLGSLDPYSGYYTREEMNAMQQDLRGQRPGVGAGLIQRRGETGVFLDFVIPRSPAGKAGLKPGDRLVSVDGRPIAALETASSALDSDKPMLLVIERDGASFEATLQRADYTLATVHGQLFPGGRGYLQVRAFPSNAASLALVEGRALVAKGARSMILDLRFNHGGERDAAFGMASLFLKAGSSVALMETRVEGRTVTETHVVEKDGAFKDLPVVILINGQSASASEIVTQALLDNGRARTVGERSYGKGSGQHFYHVRKGAQAKVTHFLWHGPSGVNVARNRPRGITPQHAVAATSSRLLEHELLGAANGGAPHDPAKDAALTKALELLR